MPEGGSDVPESTGVERERVDGYLIFLFVLLSTWKVESPREQYLWMMATVFGFGSANTATHVYASELFPTAIRATGYGWTTNLFGRVTEVGVPMLVGVCVGVVGFSMSVGLVAIGPVLGAASVLRYAPETRGPTLEEIQTLADGFGSGAAAERTSRSSGEAHLTGSSDEG